MVSRVIPVQAFDLVVFGGTGDLANEKFCQVFFEDLLRGKCLMTLS